MKPGVAAALALAASVAACGGGFRYEALSSDAHPPTQEVAWLTSEPTRPYTVVAKFRGTETALCPRSQPYCSLYERAMQTGADAIWVQRRDVFTRQEEWVMIRGEMKRIPPQQYETLEGAFVRYR